MRPCIDTVIEDQAVGSVPAEHERPKPPAATMETQPTAQPEPASTAAGRRRKPVPTEE